MNDQTTLSKFRETNTPWFGVTMMLVGVMIGYTVAGGLKDGALFGTVTPPAPPAAAPQPIADVATNVPPVDLTRDNVRGNTKAKIALIEYSDFECPYCQRNHPTMKQILEEYPDDVFWVYRHYPLPFHNKATPAAEASECAGNLGGNDAFWAFTDMIFEQGNFDFAYLAEKAGVDAKRFKACVDGKTFADRVTDDISKGNDAGVSGTPANFLVNTETGKAMLVSGAHPFENFQKVIDALLDGGGDEAIF